MNQEISCDEYASFLANGVRAIVNGIDLQRQKCRVEVVVSMGLVEVA
jgi:hypothetical protein